METVNVKYPSSLIEAIETFSDPRICLDVSDQHPKDKAEEPVKKLKGRKPPEYKAFEDMLKKVVKAPPFRKNQNP